MLSATTGTPVDDDVTHDVAPVAAPPTTSAAGSDLSSEPWLWIVVGIVAAGAIAGITAGVVVATSAPAGSQGDFSPGRLEFGP